MPSREGSPNKSKNTLLARLRRDFPNYHPIIELARIGNDPENDVATRANAHKEVAKYVTPQLKALDVTSGGNPISFNFSIAPPDQPAKVIEHEPRDAAAQHVTREALRVGAEDDPDSE